MWVDKGRKFYNKDVQKLSELYSTENEEKSCVIERFNRTTKDRIFEYFTANSTRKYIELLDKLVDQYNNTNHSSIKMSPVEASLWKNENKVWRILYPEFGGKTLTPKFSIGDNVRITKNKNCLIKITLKDGRKMFLNSRIQLLIPVIYKITDYNGEKIQGSFYEQELQKPSHGTFRIEKVVTRQGDVYLVKWMGYPKSFNSWIDTKAMVKL